VAAADFDNDGMVELWVNNRHDPRSLLKNYGKHDNWTLVTLVGVAQAAKTPSKTSSAMAANADLLDINSATKDQLDAVLGLQREK
jgi:hypothetical protein